MGLGSRALATGALATGAFGSVAFGSMLGLLAGGTRMHRFYFLAVMVAKGFAGLDSKHRAIRQAVSHAPRGLGDEGRVGARSTPRIEPD